MKRINPPKTKPVAKAVKPAKNWLTVAMADDHATITIAGAIGSSWYDATGATAKEFRNALATIPAGKPIHLHINSEGGSIQDGLEMANLIKARSKDITAFNDGYCLSIASVIPLFASRVVSPVSSVWMVHDPLVMTIGNIDEHNKSIAMLQANADVMVAIYAERTGKSEDEIRADMQAETWMTGAEAIEYGLATDSGDDNEADPDTDDATLGDAKTMRLAMAAFNAFKAKNEKISTVLNGGDASTAAGEQTQNENMKPEEKTTAVAAATPPVSAMEARFIEERKARISGEITRRAEGKLKNDQLDWWINQAVDAPDLKAEQAVYSQLDAFPVMAKPDNAGKPVAPLPEARSQIEIVAPERRYAVTSRNERVALGVAPNAPRSEFARGIRKLGTPQERVTAMRRDWSGLMDWCEQQDNKTMLADGGRTPVAANTYTSNLVADFLSDQAMTILINTWPALTTFTRDFTVDPYKSLSTVQVKFAVAAPATLVSSKTVPNLDFETASDSNVQAVAVPVLHYSQPFGVAGDEYMNGLRLENLAAINLGTLANTITLAALNPIITGAVNSSGTPNIAFSAGTANYVGSAGTFGWVKEMPHLRSYLGKSPLKNAILDPVFYSLLINQPGFFQATSVGSRGDRVSTFGWNELNENSIWPNFTNAAGNKLAGFVCNPQAICVAAGLPMTPPSGTDTLMVTTIQIPGPDIYINVYSWFMLKSRKIMCSYDLCFGAAGGDASAGAPVFNGSGGVS